MAKGITKSELRLFIHKKVNHKIDAVENEVALMVKERYTSSILDKIAKLNALVYPAGNLHKLFGDLQNEFQLTSYVYNIMRRSLKDIVDLPKDLLENELETITGIVRFDDDGTKLQILKSDDHYLLTMKSMRSETNPFRQRVAQLHTLKMEANQVIAAARSGQKAFERLQELGFDLSDFEVREEQLPQVQKLTVDPSLLN